jgi:aspartate-semialdehyde dehydrogenase
MSSNLKSPAISHADPTRGGSLYRVAIVGAGSLQGKELAEVLNDRNFPSLDVKLLDDDESLGKLESVGDEVTFIQKVRADEFRNIDFTFLAADPESARKTWKIARDAGSDIVDLTGALEDDAGAVLRSPWIERQLGQPLVPELQPGPVVTAHPAAVVLALLMLRVQKAAKVVRASATVFEPASEHGQKGMDELHQQTVNLLSFQQLPKSVFDAQVAFNMLARYGEQAASALATIENRIRRHYRKIAGASAPAVSLLLLQAPIFHGHAFALHVEIDQPVDIQSISQALAGEHINLTLGADDAPSNVNAAGQSDIQLAVLPDSTQPRSFWLWAASDNLRIAASTAVECAESMAAARPRGKIQ